MNKDISKQLVVTENVRTAEWKTYHLDSATLQKELDITYPCVLKPLSCGSSVGITVLDNSSDLQDAIEAAKVYESEILIERKIVGREFSVGILGDKVLPPIEIISQNGFYGYTNEYQTGGATEICPADITKKLEDVLGNLLISAVLRVKFKF